MDDKTITKLIDKMTKTHNVLILGNGFDLHLGLKSSFSNFFGRCVLKNGLYEGNNLLYLLLYLRFYRSDNLHGFFRAVDTTDPNWMDVESFIKKIATEPEFLRHLYESALPQTQTKILDSLQFKIRDVIKSRMGPMINYNYSTIKRILSEDLDAFEKQFSKYLKRRLKRITDYDTKQQALLDKIIKCAPVNNDFLTQIINFNYTSVECGKYCCEANVHGTLNSKIVIGYDSTEKEIDENNIFELSKEWRKIDIDFSYDFDRKGVQSIIVYGHSLGEQDYPYFFELFDMCDFFYKQNYGSSWKETAKQVNLYICYSKFGDKNTQKRELQKLEMNVSKLLNAYERYKYPSLKRNTIITNLKIKKQISFIEIK